MRSNVRASKPEGRVESREPHLPSSIFHLLRPRPRNQLNKKPHSVAGSGAFGKEEVLCRALATGGDHKTQRLGFLDLPVLQLHRRVASEDADTDAELAALGVDFLDDTLLVLEGAVGDLDLVADLINDLGGDGVLALFHLRKHGLDLFLPHRDGLVLGAGESDDSGGVLDEVPGLVDEFVVLIEEMHVNDQVSGEELARGLGLLAALDLLNSLGRDQHLKDMVAEFLGWDSLDDVVVDFLFLS